MAAIVRVKRRRDEDPANSIVLKCKKVKQHVSEDQPVKKDGNGIDSVFKFAGTLSEKAASVCSQVRDAIRKEKLQKEYKQHNVRISEKVRTWHKSFSDKGRYKIVAERRAVDLGELDNDIRDREPEYAVKKDEALGGRSAAEKRGSEQESEGKVSKKMYHLYDVVPDDLTGAQAPIPQAADAEVITCNNIPMVREKVQPPPPAAAAAAAAAVEPQDYVYDIYYMNSASFDFRMLENILSVEAYGDSNDLMTSTYGEGREEVYDDEDDSNEEDNWRNDYPDEDPKYYENDQEEEYGYGEDGYAEGKGLDSDDEPWGLSDLVHKGLSINAEAHGDPDGASSDSDIDAYADEPVTGDHGDSLWVPPTSYEQYKANVSMELGMNGEDGCGRDDD